LLRRGGLTATAIARVLGRHRSTIVREVRRNLAASDGTYRPQLADWYARGRRTRSRRNRRFTATEWRRVRRLLEQQWSPEQVAGYLRLHRRLQISHETIYRYIWAEKRQGGTLYTHLRGAQKQRRKRYGRYDSRGRLAGKRSITARPAAVATRTQLGHWEVDTMLGSGQAGPCVLTLVERKTGYVVIGKLPARTTANVNRRATQLLRRQRGGCGQLRRTTGPSSMATPRSSGRSAPAFTSPRPIMPGNAAPTKTPTGSSGSISRKARAWHDSPNKTAMPLRGSSIDDLGNAWAIVPRRNAMNRNPHCCTSKLILSRNILKGSETGSL